MSLVYILVQLLHLVGVGGLDKGFLQSIIGIEFVCLFKIIERNDHNIRNHKKTYLVATDFDLLLFWES